MSSMVPPPAKKSAMVCLTEAAELLELVLLDSAGTWLLILTDLEY